MTKILTQPSEQSVFLVAAGGVTLAVLALLFVPTPHAEAQGGDAGTATSQPAGSQPAGSQPAGSQPAGKIQSVETSKVVRPVVSNSTGAAVSSFPMEKYETLLSTYQEKNGFVNYEGLAGPGKAELTALADAIAQTDSAELERLRDGEYASWYINAYNILTLKTIVDHYPVKSIMDINQPWDTPLTVAGKQMTLNHIEHEILRMKSASVEKRKGFVNPSLHFAVNCASIGCPRLQAVPFTAANLEELYLKGARDFAANPNQFKFSGNTLSLSQLMDWYGDDFSLIYGDDSAELAATLNARGVQQAEKVAAVAWYFALHVEDQELAKNLRAGNYDVTWLDYDWNLNKQ